MLKPKFIKKEGRILYIYFKIPYFGGYRKIHNELEKFIDKDSSLNIGIDETGKYAFLGYFLRSKEDILPYVKNKK